MRIFFDSSVMFAAAYSARGHSRDLILMATRGEIVPVISQFVLTETRRNLAESAPEHLPFLERVIKNIAFEIVQYTKREVMAASKHVVLKDAPILAAARRAKVDLLVTLDKKHLLGRPALAKYARTEIVTPQEAVARLSHTD